MIGAHPNAPVAPISKDGLDQIGGQAIALGKRFHLSFRMTLTKGIAKCGRIQPPDPSAPHGSRPEISAAIKSGNRRLRKRRGNVPVIVVNTVRTGGAV
jgi:hypothetical protein